MVDNEKSRTYIIPDNFIAGGRVFNGMFKTRNFIEGAIIGITLVGIAMLFPIQETATRISVVIGFSAPGFFLGAAGFNDDALSVVIFNMIRWKRQKYVMLYNTANQAREAQPLDMMMAEELPRDRMISVFEAWNQKRKEKQAKLMEQTTYEFEEDSELKLLSPKDRAKRDAKKLGRRNRAYAEAVKDIDDLDAEQDNVEYLVPDEVINISSVKQAQLDIDESDFTDRS